MSNTTRRTVKKSGRPKSGTKMPPGVGLSPEAKKADKEAQAAKDLAEAQAALAELYEGVENPKPHLECRIYPLPEYCSVSSIAMRELDGEDDIMSAYWADQHATEAEKQSSVAAQIADQREGIRISLVGVNGRQVNDDGAPYMECDEWTSKTWRFLMQYFAELNGVSNEDLKNGVRGSTPIVTTLESGTSRDSEPVDE